MITILSLIVAGCAPKSPEPAVPAVSVGTPLVLPLDPQASAEVQAEAIVAYNEGDHATFLAKSQQAASLDPQNLVALYNVACGQALLGHRDAALATLRRLLAAGVDFGAARDPDFGALRDDPEFGELIESFAALFPPISLGARAFDLGDALDLAPEGIAHDPATGRFFVGSTRKGAIFAVAPDGTVTEHARLTVGDVPVSTLGLEVAGDRLWAVGTSFDFHERFEPEHRGVTAVFGVDLQSGAIRETYAAPEPQLPFGFNDVSVGEDGSIYLSGPGVWVVRPGASAPEPLGEQPRVHNSNGISADGDHLYVAADTRNVARIDLTTMQREWLVLPDGVNLRSFDGLYRIDGGLVGIQLGLGAWRVVRVDLADDGLTVTGVEILEQSNPEIRSATTGAVVGDDLYVITREPLAEGVDPALHGPAPGRAVVWRVPIHP